LLTYPQIADTGIVYPFGSLPKYEQLQAALRGLGAISVQNAWPASQTLAFTRDSDGVHPNVDGAKLIAPIVDRAL
jgi:lysophospholipase L1-like esterase